MRQNQLQRRKRIRRNRAVLIVFIVFAVLLVSTMLGSHNRKRKLDNSDVLSITGMDGDMFGADANTHASEYEKGSIDITETRMLLVNNNVPVPESMDIQLRKTDDGAILDDRAAKAWEDLRLDALEAGFDLTVQYGYLSQEDVQTERELTKQKLMNDGMKPQKAEEKAESLVGNPGHSEHETGFAIDVYTEETIGDEVAYSKTKACGWLIENAEKYGFVRRYTEENQQLTGMTPNVSHYRYIGKHNAYNAAGMSLEEIYAIENG